MKIIAGYVDISDMKIMNADDAKKLTHINLSFGYINQGVIEFDKEKLFSKLHVLREANPELKILLSLVGKTGTDFTQGSDTAAGRKKIAASCAEVINKYGFDGIDLDWEFPCCPENMLEATAADKKNFTYLIQEIRTAMDKACAPGKLLTIAAGADEYFTENTEMDVVSKYLDYVFVMTYDLRCGFHALSGHHTNLYTASGDIFRTSCKRSVDLYRKAGVPDEKIIIGAAFYSRKFINIPDRFHGFLQYTPDACTYGPSYHTLVEEYIDKNGYVRYWDDECKAPYLYDGNTFITYDDPESLRHKSTFIQEEDIGGIFYWNHSNDETHMLLTTLYEALGENQ